MKKAIPILILFLLVCRFLYPHTRFAHKKDLSSIFDKKLNCHKITLETGEKFVLKPEKLRQLAKYSSSDFRIASVSPSGTVRAHSPGTAIIYVKQGNETYRCKVLVRTPEKT